MLVEKLIPRVESLKVGPFERYAGRLRPDGDEGAPRKRSAYVDLGIKEGAKLKVDGRNFKLQGYENGLFPSEAASSMRSASTWAHLQGGTFGPVLTVVRAKDYDEALRLPSEHEYGNGAAIFTRDGDTARDFTARLHAGHGGRQLRHSRVGWPTTCSAAGSDQDFGDLNQHGPDAVRFYMKTKTVTSAWPSGTKEGADFIIPTIKVGHQPMALRSPVASVPPGRPHWQRGCRPTLETVILVMRFFLTSTLQRTAR